MKRKSLAPFLICLMSAMLLAGCGAATDSNLKDKPESVKENTEVVGDNGNKDKKKRRR